MNTKPRVVIQEVLNKLNSVVAITWDRFTIDNDFYVVYGWINRTDGQRDFIMIALYENEPIDDVFFTTSSAKYSAKFCEALYGSSENHNNCLKIGELFPELANKNEVQKPDMSTASKEAVQLDKQDAYYEPLFSNDNLQNELWTATAELGAISPLDSQIDDFLHSLWQRGFVVARMDSVRELMPEPAPVKSVSMADGVNALRAALSNDPEIFGVWADNISVAFQETYNPLYGGYHDPKPATYELKKVADEGAVRFLNLLIDGQK